jgi:hypothetical protein
MLSYRLSQHQDATWRQCGAAQVQLEQAIAAILSRVTDEGVLVVSFQGFPLFYVEAGGGQ